MPGNFVRSALFTGSVDLIRELGGSPAAVARAAGIPVAALRDPDLIIPGRPAYAVFERAAEMCGCRTFGLRLGSRARVAAVIGPLWVLVRNATTLGEMFEELSDNFDIYTSIATMGIERTRDGMIVWWSSIAGFTSSEVQMAEYAIGVLVQEVRLHAGRAWTPASVEFRHSAPGNLADHRRLIGSNLAFDRDRNSIFIENATLRCPLEAPSARSRALVGTLLRRDEEMVDADVGARVESIVRALLPFGPCTVHDVAKAMSLPVRTLQHHLDAGGLSFTQIKDKVRADLARKYLEHSRLALSEVAEILGYSQLSAFSRSFRRWHGRSARALRGELRGDGGRRKPPAAPRSRGR